MSAKGLNKAVEKMRAHGINQTAIDSFTHLYHTWEDSQTSWIKESDVDPLSDIPSVKEVLPTINSEEARTALSKTAYVKLNGGLGTSMGLSKAKSLLPVRTRSGKTLNFLDIILGQVIATRKKFNIDLPLIFMNSYRTSADTLNVISKHTDFHQEGFPVEIIQNREPKIRIDGEPVEWEKNPDLEWCPPGHGDLFPTLAASGILDTLSEKGIKYLFISNSDNLGARPSAKIAGYFARSNAPFMMEVARRTPSDVKGGQIVKDKKTGRLMLREMSQVCDDDLKYAMDITRHAYFNTNNLWVRIDSLKQKLEENHDILSLPVIINNKTVDPKDSSSTPVIQLETAMGAAIGQFDGSICLEVDKPRFLPVKTTNDLLIMRSNRFHLTNEFEMEDGNYIFPQIHLDKRFYKKIDDFNQRFPKGVPSLAATKSVTINGDWTFGENDAFFGDAVLEDLEKPMVIPENSYIGPKGVEEL